MKRINGSKSIHNSEKRSARKTLSKQIKVVDPPKKETKPKTEDNLTNEIEHLTLDSLKI